MDPEAIRREILDNAVEIRRRIKSLLYSRVSREKGRKNSHIKAGAACVICGRTNISLIARGMCGRCYRKDKVKI
jgi:hypothetical protein